MPPSNRLPVSNYQHHSARQGLEARTDFVAVPPPHGAAAEPPADHCSQAGRARLGTLLIAFILISVSASALVAMRGRAATNETSTTSASIADAFHDKQRWSLAARPHLSCLLTTSRDNLENSA